MKLYKYCFALLALTTVTVSGCKNEDINEEARKCFSVLWRGNRHERHSQ